MYLYVLVLGFSVQHEGACAKGQLVIQRLVDCDCSMTDTFWNYGPKKSELWWASYRLADCVGAKIGKCVTCLSPVWKAQVQLLGKPASDTSWYYWYHSTQHARQVGYSALLGMNVTTWLSLGLEAATAWLSILSQCGLKIQTQTHFCSINSKYCIESGFKCSMAPSWSVYNQFVIKYKQICAHTNQYKSIHTNTYHNTCNDMGLQVGINTYCV